jgi:hypothetical protein
MVEVPEFSLKMTNRAELLEGDEFLVESLVIALDLATTAWIIRPTEDQFDSLFLRFSFEDLGDELFTIIEVNFTRDSSGAECPAESIDR